MGFDIHCGLQVPADELAPLYGPFSHEALPREGVDRRVAELCEAAAQHNPHAAQGLYKFGTPLVSRFLLNEAKQMSRTVADQPTSIAEASGIQEGLHRGGG